jgi:hypothetical protein
MSTPFNIGRNVNFVDSTGTVKSLVTELAKIGTGGGGGSTVVDSTTNGNILVNGSEVQVYDETTLKNNVGTVTNLTTTDKTSLVSAINEVKSSSSTNTTSIGTLSSLQTTAKSNLVSAINEVKSSIGTGGGATNLDALTDVDTSTVSPIEGNVLKYTGGVWKPGTDATGATGGAGSKSLITTYTHTGNTVIQPTALDKTTGIYTTGAAHGLSVGDTIYLNFNTWATGSSLPISKAPFELYSTTYNTLGCVHVVNSVPSTTTFTIRNIVGNVDLVYTGNGTVNDSVDVTAFHFEKLVQFSINGINRDNVYIRFSAISPKTDGAIQHYGESRPAFASTLNFVVGEMTFSSVSGMPQAMGRYTGTSVRLSPSTANYSIAILANQATTNWGASGGVTFGNTLKVASPVITNLTFNFTTRSTYLNGSVFEVYDVSVANSGALITTSTYNSNPVTLATAVTFDSTTDKVTITAHGLAAGTAIAFVPDWNATSSDLPTGLIFGRTYFVFNPTANDFQLSETSATPTAKDFTTNGTQLHWHMEVLSAKHLLTSNVNLDGMRLVILPRTSSPTNAFSVNLQVSVSDAQNGGYSMAVGGGGGTYGYIGGLCEVLLRGYNGYGASFLIGSYLGYDATNTLQNIGDVNSKPQIMGRQWGTSSPFFPTVDVAVGANNNPFLLNGFKVEVWNL